MEESEQPGCPPAAVPHTRSGMAPKVGVMGGATGVRSADHLARAHALGRAVARAGCVLITGACPGLPLAAACGAKEAGGTVVGISPAVGLSEHVGKYQSPQQFHDVLVFTGSGLMGREVVNIRTSDVVVIVGGRSGTLGELAIAYDEGKVIGVLTGTGGITDLIPDILAACAKETGARAIYDADPERLVGELLRLFREAPPPAWPCDFDGLPPFQEPAEVGTVTDPVCGMKIHPSAGAAERRVGDTRFVFCSTACLSRFDADPSAYLPSAGATGHAGPGTDHAN